VRFDRGHFNQVLWNLCSNGLRYGKREAGSLMLHTRFDGAQVILTITDDGCGVSVENQARLFEPFFTTDKEGTGLGLYIAKELCEANNVRLEYVPLEGRVGACFRMIFGELHEHGK
jgi:two-component system sensor histidine kinase PilS (NtrC family)